MPALPLERNRQKHSSPPGKFWYWLAEAQPYPAAEAAERLPAGDRRLPLGRRSQEKQHAAPLARGELHGPLGLLVGPDQGHGLQFQADRRRDLAFHLRAFRIIFG